VGTVADYDNKFRNYGYRDFENCKIRVIYLNSADVSDEAVTGSCYVSEAQLNWLKTVALNLADSSWGIIVLSHHPLNWNAADGTQFDMMAGVRAALSNYKAKGEGAELIAHFHGHLHNFRVETLDGILSVTIPNACKGRENSYGVDSRAYIREAYGDPVPDPEDASTMIQRICKKTANTAQDTAFDVVVIDRQTKKIRCFHYGAGVDREINY
jgi:hypothetical protein